MLFVHTMERRDELRPDVPVEESAPLALAGREFDVRVTDRAATDADIWLYDDASGVAIVGWRMALDQVRSVPFSTAIPGHGEPMSREQFDRWRGAFNAFMRCVESESPAAECAAGWREGVAPLLGDDERVRAMASEYAHYYVGMLRENGGKSAECLAP